MSYEGTVVVNYRLVRQLGEGGFGVVYLAEHEDLGRQVAVKILHPEFARRGDLVDRFFREAKAVCAIDHPAILDVQNFGRLDSGEPYYLMEYFRGATLTERVAALGPLPGHEVTAIFGPVAAALTAAHASGVIHRDLKPDNVMVRDELGAVGDVKLLDFGIAKLLDPADAGHSQTGYTMGTPAFMAPEQARDAKNVDVRADVYAFGATVYNALAGRPPFVADNVTDLIVAVHTTEAPRLSSLAPVSPALEAAVHACLAKTPEGRPATIEAAWSAIAAALEGPVAAAERGPASAARLAATVAPASAARLAPTVAPTGPTTPASPVGESTRTTLGAAATSSRSSGSSGSHGARGTWMVLASAAVLVAGIGAAVTLGGQSASESESSRGTTMVADDPTAATDVPTGEDTDPPLVGTGEGTTKDAGALAGAVDAAPASIAVGGVPVAPRSKRQRSKDAERLGTEAAKRGDWAVAVREFSTSLELAPRSSVRIKRATAYLQQGNKKAACADYGRLSREAKGRARVLSLTCDVDYDKARARTRQNVLNAARRQRNAIARCLRKTGASGRLRMRVTINAAGRVTGVIASGPLASTPAAPCVEGLIRKTAFPAGTGSMTFELPFAKKIAGDKK